VLPSRDPSVSILQDILVVMPVSGLQVLKSRQALNTHVHAHTQVVQNAEILCLTECTYGSNILLYCKLVHVLDISWDPAGQ